MATARNRVRLAARSLAITIRLLPFVVLAATVLPATAQQALPDEHLTYDVVYHWGLIWKRAAVGTLAIEQQGDTYRATMTAATMRFADPIFKVRDTLVSVMRVPDLQPIHFTKVAREGKFYQIDDLTYTHRGDSTLGHTVLTRPGKDFREEIPMAVRGEAYDMLSVFYRVRRIPFATMKEGDIYSTPIFSGRNIEQLDIEFCGTTTVEVMDTTMPAYYLRFRFYDRNGKKTSDKISAWISTTDFIPLRLEGKLPIGSMKVILVERK